jgi:hypothetical protein
MSLLPMAFAPFAHIRTYVFIRVDAMLLRLL